MKKRFKLITTIAAISLALAIMVFGVYAASSTTFTITSTASFTPGDMFVTCDVYLYYGTATNTSNTATQATGAHSQYVSYTGSGTSKAPKTDTAQTITATPTANPLSSTNKVLRFVITIRNDGPFALAIGAATETATTSTNMTLSSSTNDYNSSTGLTAGSTYTYTRYATITDLRKNASVAFSAAIAISKKA
ncbi:MAG: hypothetical protein J6T74_04330 [Clostridia bacterium]|nr:hypothetical protein [Clostridia bacterium]